MAGEETSIGGPRRSFPTTLWSELLSGQGADPSQKRRSLECLFSRYWKPVYCSIRYGWRVPPEEAKDTVQEFFLDLFERDAFRDLDPSRGRFRSFLKAALRHFMMNLRRDAARLKRGGGAKLLGLGDLEAPRACPGPPDEVLDREWMGTMLARALEQLRQDLQREEKEIYYRVFERYDLAEGDVSYRIVAAETGLTESDVRNYLHFARQALRQIVTRQVSEYAANGADLREDVAWILG